MENSPSFLGEVWIVIKDLFVIALGGLWAIIMSIVNRITKRQDKIEEDFSKLVDSCHRFRVEAAEKRMDLATKKDIEAINDRLNEIMKLYSKSIEHYESIRSILGFIVKNKGKRSDYDGN